MEQLPPELSHLARAKIEIPVEKIREKAGRLQEEYGDKLETLEMAGAQTKIEGASLPSDRHEQNQDAKFAYIGPNGDFWVAGVCDGVGGSKGGALASHMLKDQILQALQRTEREKFDALIFRKEILKRVADTLTTVRQELERMGLNGPELANADTAFTIAVGFPSENGQEVYCLSASDSPTYIQDKQGYYQITKEDSPVGNMLAENAIDRLRAKVHPQKNKISHSLRRPPKSSTSIGELDCNITEEEYPKGVRMVIVTDGLSAQFRDDPEYNELGELFKLTPKEMVAAAKLRSEQHIPGLSKDDDITAMRIDFNA